MIREKEDEEGGETKGVFVLVGSACEVVVATEEERVVVLSRSRRTGSKGGNAFVAVVRVKTMASDHVG